MYKTNVWNVIANGIAFFFPLASVTFLLIKFIKNWNVGQAICSPYTLAYIIIFLQFLLFT